MSYHDKVSIIVPVYNCKKEILERCLNSIKSQTCQNFEAIIVDDGSKEEFAKYCDAYQDIPNFKIFHKPNGGVTTTRNFGLDHATGDWILFIDNDDWIDNETIKYLLSKIDQSDYDIAYFDSYRYHSNGKSELIHSLDYEDNTIINSNKQHEILLDLISNGYGAKQVRQGFLEVWCKIFNKKYIDKYHLRFHEELTIADDMMFNIDFCQCQTFKGIYFQKPLYNRFFNSLSDSNSYHPEIRENDKKFINLMQQATNYQSDNQDIKNAFSKRYVLCSIGVISYDMAHKKNPKSFSVRLNNLKEFLSSEPYHSAIKNCKYSWFNIFVQGQLFLLKTHQYRLFLTIISRI